MIEFLSGPLVVLAPQRMHTGDLVSCRIAVFCVRHRKAVLSEWSPLSREKLRRLCQHRHEVSIDTCQTSFDVDADLRRKRRKYTVLDEPIGERWVGENVYGTIVRCAIASTQSLSDTLSKPRSCKGRVSEVRRNELLEIACRYWQLRQYLDPAGGIGKIHSIESAGRYQMTSWSNA